MRESMRLWMAGLAIVLSPRGCGYNLSQRIGAIAGGSRKPALGGAGGSFGGEGASGRW